MSLHARTVFVGAATVLLLGVPAKILPLMQTGGELRLRSNTRVVEVEITVRDSQGIPVGNLNKEDFKILDDGKPRAFAIFHVNRAAGPATGVASPAPETSGSPAWPKLPPNVFSNIGPPLGPPDGHSTVILLDGINGWFDNFAYARTGVMGMLSKVPADEKIALYVIVKNRGLVILQDYTVDRARLLDAITKYIPVAMCQAPAGSEHGEGMIDPIYALSPPPASPRGGESDSAEVSRSARMAALKRYTAVPPCITPGPKGMDLMEAGAEAVRLSLNALADKLARQPGRKSVFWMSQGFPVPLLRGEFETAWDKTITALNDANIAVNAIDSNGLDGPPRMWGPGEILTMKRLAEDTGGQAYYFRNDLDTALASGIAESRSSYTLGFYLTDVDGKYHTLKVRVDRPGVSLGYRQGYFAVDETRMEVGQKKSDLSAALLNPGNSAAVGIVASLDLMPGKPRASLKVRLKLDPDTLSVQTSAAGLTGKVEEMFVEFNQAGREVGRISATSPFQIRPENRESYGNDGVTMVQTVPVSPDAVKLSIIVRDSESGRIGSLTLPLDQVAPPPR